MSFRPVFQRRTLVPVASTLLAGGIALYPRRIAYAEEPRDIKKPIYDDFPIETPKAPISTPPAVTTAPETSSEVVPATSAPSQTPTDILAAQIRQARLFLYAHALSAENGFNDFLSRVLHIENAFTNTVASLAPSPESGERLLPGGVYVIVSAMAGSIVSRNRGVFLRTASPLAFGTAAAWYLLPVTMRNISDLVWEYEKKVPVVAEQHLKIRDQAEYIWTTGVAHSGMARQRMEDKIGDARRKLEELVSKGH